LKPKVLVVATARWFTTARLAVALANAGCTVEGLCPSQHPMVKTSAVSKIYSYNGLAPRACFGDAIAESKPDIIVPGDDLATWHLHHLHHREQKHRRTGGLICSTIERSLGAPDSFSVVHARTTFIELAQEEGVRAPRTAVMNDADDLRRWSAETGFPAVLKANDTSGGEGVRIVHTLEHAEQALRALQAPPLLARAAKRALIDRDTALVWPSLLRHRHVVNAQAYVAGREATSAVACWKGSVLATLHFEVLKKRSLRGPATVVQRIDNPEMSAAAEKIVRRLNLSGLHGFDFVLEAETGNAFLLEINPRATQVTHLTLGAGQDLPAALRAAVSGETFQPAPKVTENDIITLFPHEWLGDPHSLFLHSSYHDVPWEEPELLRACVHKSGKRRAWFSRSEPDWMKASPAVRFRRL